ncbi:N-carbamoylputrescine amidase [Thiohalospira halophila DSM 15071]|uniref:N-carbamoylputrescine amidase n=1 Tax=Thiohalospira halophila DSM 15071 TaxID=1123397 RepID=A0A1I1P1W0_9GAMM|nr:carbon-nitrogen hydrolase [Thiohalospira halophila]SFD03807.1 N-carbamoylputrescine amidase [Thiohalospira halophila DSM 15071]
MANHQWQLGLVQGTGHDDPEAALAAMESGIREAAGQGADLVLLPELHNGPYFCQTEDPTVFDRAEPVPGPTTQRLGRVAAETGTVIVGSVFEHRAPGLAHNTAVVLDRDGSLAGTYRKMHIPDDPGYYEKFYFTPGDTGFRPVETSLGRLGVLVCWDQWFPEAARLMAMAGAEILLYPTAIGSDPRDDAAEQARQIEAWQTVQRGHAVANGLPLAACNRVGHEPDPAGGPGIDFWGRSFVCGPQGEWLEQPGGSSTGVRVVPVSRRRSEEVRRMWPFFRDRRVDAYADLVKRWRDDTV